MEPHATTAESVIIDPQGDASILVSGKDRAKRFTVSSSALMLACEPWRNMLKYRGHLGSDSTEGVAEYSLGDDDVWALELLFRIAHLQFDQVPNELDYDQLVSVAVLTDKYQATRLVRPWIQSWVKHVHHLARVPGYENYIWIAWDFGLIDDFETVAERMTQNATVDDEGEYILPGDVLQMPPGLSESIMAARSVALDRLLAIPYRYIDRLTNSVDESTVCQEAENHACDALSFGSLSLALMRRGLWPERKTAIDLCKSIEQLSSELYTISPLHYPHSGEDPDDYYHDQRCTFFISSEMGKDVDKVMGGIPSSVTSAHRKHIKRQRELLGLTN